MNHGRKISGGKYHANRKKRPGNFPIHENKSSLGEPKTKKIRTKGSHEKTIILKSNIVNISTGKKTEKAEIKNVLQTPQNIFLARENRLIKGAIIQTSKGKARITNRPSREGVVNAVLTE